VSVNSSECNCGCGLWIIIAFLVLILHGVSRKSELPPNARTVHHVRLDTSEPEAYKFTGTHEDAGIEAGDAGATVSVDINTSTFWNPLPDPVSFRVSLGSECNGWRLVEATCDDCEAFLVDDECGRHGSVIMPHPKPDGSYKVRLYFHRSKTSDENLNGRQIECVGYVNVNTGK